MVDPVTPNEDFQLVNPFLGEVEEDTDLSLATTTAAAESYPESPEGIQDAQLESAEAEQAERSKTAVDNVNYFGEIPILSALGRTAAIGGTDLINETDKFFGISDSLKKYYGIDIQAGDDTLLAEPEEIGLNPRSIWEAGGATLLHFGIPFTGIGKVPGFLQWASKLTQSMGLLKSSPRWKGVLDGALGSIPIDYALFNPDDPNAINAGLDSGFFEKISFGLIANDSSAGIALREALAQDPNSPEWVNRGRNAAVGLLAGSIAEGMLSILKATNSLVRGAKEELDTASKEYATNLLNEIDKIKATDPKSLDDLAKTLPEDNLRAEDFVTGEPETAGEALARVAKEGNDFHATPSPKRDIKNPQYEVTPDEEQALLKIATDALEGRKIDMDDPKLPINLNKIETSEQLKSVIHAIGKVIHDKLDKNLPMTEYADKAASILGKINAKTIQNAAEELDYNRGYVVASKLMVVNSLENHLKHNARYLANPTDTVAQFHMNTSQLEVAETVNAAANLATAGGRFLAEFKKVAKELTVDEKKALWKADLLNRMIDSGKVTLKKAQRARKLVDDAAFKSKNVRKGDTDPAKVRRQRKKRPKDTSRKEEREAIKGGISRKTFQIGRSNEMQLQTLLAYEGKSRFVRTRDAALEIYINGLLSRPTTQFVNFAGNTSALMTSVFERAWAGFRNTDKDGIQLKEAYYLMSGMTEAITKDAMKIFRKSYREGPSDLSIKTDMSRPHHRALSAEAQGASGQLGKTLDWIGHKVNIPGRLLMSMDEVFKAINYRGQVNALAFRKAHQDVVDNLGRLPQTDAERALVVENYSKTFEVGGMPDEIVQEATDFARFQTFTNELASTAHVDRSGKIVQTTTSGFFKKAIESDPTGFLKFQFPFFQTPVNLIKYGAERTAIMRRFTPLMDELKSADPVVKQLAEAKVATGNMLTATGVMMAFNGLVTGAPPANHKLRAAYEAAGIRPYHIWIPFLGYRPYSRLDPLGMSIANAANLAIFAKSMISITGQALDTQLDRNIFEAYKTAFAQVGMGTARLLTDKHYLQTAGILANAVDGDGYDIQRVFGNLSPNKILFPYSSLRAGIMKGINADKPFKLGDPSVLEEGDTLSEFTSKELSQEWDNFWEDTFRTHLPFWRDPDDFEPDVVGEPTFFPGGGSEEIHLTPSRLLNRSLEVVGGVLKQTLHPFPEAVRSKSPLKNKIAELGIEAIVPRNIRSIRGVELSTEERKYWGKIYTDLNKEYEKEVKTKAFNQMPEGEQKAEIELQLRVHHQQATSQTLGKFERINEFAAADTHSKLLQREQPVAGADIQNLFNIGQQ